MASKTYAALTTTTTVLDADLLATFSGGGPLKAITAANTAAYYATKLSATWLLPANNLSDVANAATARGNLGAAPTASPAFTGTVTAATLTLSGALSGVGGTFSGAISAAGVTSSAGMTVTGGAIIYTGASVSTINTGGAGTLDCSVSDFHQRSISGNTTYTLQGGTAAKSSTMLLELTISSAAIPTFTGAKWDSGIVPTLPNGRSLLGFSWNGTDWTAVLIAQAIA